MGSKPERYQFIRKTLVDFVYCKSSKPDKGLLRQYLSKITGYSPSQLSRLISKHRKTGKVDWKPAKNNGFCQKYSHNSEVEDLLNQLIIDFTKSRSRKSNDKVNSGAREGALGYNALTESKNASVVRKILGYSHIPKGFASIINQFNLEFVYPYINFHKPCAFPEIKIDKKSFIHKKTE